MKCFLIINKYIPNNKMNNNELNSESIIIANCVITKFSGEGPTKGLRICKISWFENRIGRNASSLIKISSGSRLNDNLIITDLLDGKITYDDVMNAWIRGKIGDLTRKYKGMIRTALDAPHIPPSPYIIEPTHYHSASSLYDILETLNIELPKKSINITHFDPSKSKFKCDINHSENRSSQTGFIIRVYKDEGYYLIELQRINGDRSVFCQIYDIVWSILSSKNMIADIPRSSQSFHQFKPHQRHQINTSFTIPLPPSPLSRHL